MPVYICPNCKNRSVDIDGFEGFTTSDALQCRRCGFGFVFQLLEDFYPAPATGFVVCDGEARVLAVGRGIFELTGFRDGDLMGQEVATALALSDDAAIEVVREWGVRKLGQQLELVTRAGIRKPVTVDLFPAYDNDGGMLVALTPRTG
jgi:DNA-directed RNA polymerase subunit RPC12/RpoP